MSWDDLIEYNRRWVEIHKDNGNQAEAARRMSAMIAKMDELRTDEAVERVVEAIYRSHDSSAFYSAKSWAEMVKSKDKANKFRVKQDRATARAAISALIGDEG